MSYKWVVGVLVIQSEANVLVYIHVYAPETLRYALSDNHSVKLPLPVLLPRLPCRPCYCEP